MFKLWNYNVFKIKMNAIRKQLHVAQQTLMAWKCKISLNFIINLLSSWRSLPATAAYKRARECVNLLQCWKSSYMATRAYIEDSGVGSRWEFDKKTLFGLVDHVTRISQDIADIAKVKHLSDYRCLLDLAVNFPCRHSTSLKICLVTDCVRTLLIPKKLTSCWRKFTVS